MNNIIIMDVHTVDNSEDAHFSMRLPYAWPVDRVDGFVSISFGRIRLCECLLIILGIMNILF